VLQKQKCVGDGRLWDGFEPVSVLQVGCGSTELGARPWAGAPGYFDMLISDAEFERETAFVKEKNGVLIRDKEHLAYYRIFR
jgi:hypothetical protein